MNKVGEIDVTKRHIHIAAAGKLQSMQNGNTAFSPAQVHVYLPRNAAGIFVCRPRTAVRIADKHSFEELFAHVFQQGLPQFSMYGEKLKEAKKSTGESEAVLCGTARFDGQSCAVFIMNPYFYYGKHGLGCGRKNHPLNLNMPQNIALAGRGVQRVRRAPVLAGRRALADADGQDQRRRQAAQPRRGSCTSASLPTLRRAASLPASPCRAISF